MRSILEIRIYFWSRLLIHPRGVEGAHDFLGNSANTDLIRQAKGEPGQAPVPTPTLETNKQELILPHYLYRILKSVKLRPSKSDDDHLMPLRFCLFLCSKQ